MYPDFVLKVEEDSRENGREEAITTWLKNRLNVSSTVIRVKERGKVYRLMEE